MISVKTEQQKSLFLYMQKKKMAIYKNCSLPLSLALLLWPCSACLAWSRQWVLDGELLTVQQGCGEGIVAE